MARSIDFCIDRIPISMKPAKIPLTGGIPVVVF